MAEFDFDLGGKNGIFKNKWFMIGAVGAVGLGGYALMKKSSASSSAEEEVVYVDENYPSPLNNVDTQASLQNFSDIMLGQMDAGMNAMYNDVMNELKTVQTDIGESTQQSIDQALDEYQKETHWNGDLSTGTYGNREYAQKVAGILATDYNAKDVQVVPDHLGSGRYRVQGQFYTPARALEIANRIKQRGLAKLVYTSENNETAKKEKAKNG
jgi:hypothetical protein